MCKAVEDYARERVVLAEVNKSVEVVNNLLQKGFSLAETLKLADIDEETYRQYTENK